MPLLQNLLHLGFDAPEVDAQDWPQPCSLNWISEEFTPDPFFIEYITLLCKDNQGSFPFSISPYICLFRFAH